MGRRSEYFELVLVGLVAAFAYLFQPVFERLFADTLVAWLEKYLQDSEAEVLVLIALPGVNPDGVEAAIDGPDLVVAGVRVLPRELDSAIIHRLELPQGRFERRVRLPGGRYSSVRRSAVNGCLLIALAKTGAARG